MSRRKREAVTRITLEVRTDDEGRTVAEVIGLRYSTIGAKSPLDAACRIAELAAQVFREELAEPRKPW